MRFRHVGPILALLSSSPVLRFRFDVVIMSFFRDFPSHGRAPGAAIELFNDQPTLRSFLSFPAVE